MDRYGGDVIMRLSRKLWAVLAALLAMSGAAGVAEAGSISNTQWVYESTSTCVKGYASLWNDSGGNWFSSGVLSFRANAQKQRCADSYSAPVNHLKTRVRAMFRPGTSGTWTLCAGLDSTRYNSTATATSLYNAVGGGNVRCGNGYYNEQSSSYVLNSANVWLGNTLWANASGKYLTSANGGGSW